MLSTLIAARNIERARRRARMGRISPSCWIDALPGSTPLLEL